MTKPEVSKELDAIADVVLRYKPKPKSDVAKKRKKMAANVARAAASLGASKNDPQHKK